MEKKQLLIVSKNTKLLSNLEYQGCLPYEVTSVKSVHAAYPLALSYLPDVILIEYSSLEEDQDKSLKNFKATHFLNKSFLFLLAKEENRKELNEVKENVDHIIYDSASIPCLLEEIESFIGSKKYLSNYWKDSFMGLFNLMDKPVILLQSEKVVAMNDSFKKDFFMMGKKNVKLSDMVIDKNKNKVKEVLHRFLKGKHIKATTTAVLKVNDRLREAKIRFSKLDRSFPSQMIMLIDFTGKDFPLNDDIGSVSTEAASHTRNNTKEDPAFTKREKEVITLLCKGYKTKEISEALCISSKTIEKHRANIVKRTNSGTILESVVYALNNNLIEI